MTPGARGRPVRTLPRGAPRGPARPPDRLLVASLTHSLLAGRRSVLLEQPDADGAPVRRRVPLAHIEDERHLAVRAVGGHAPLAVGEAVTVSVPVSGSVWRLGTTVLAAGESSGAQLVLLDWPASVERTAGRRHARVPASLAARLAPPYAGAPTICAYTIDVSGTGVQVVTPLPQAAGALVEVELRLGTTLIPFTGRVRWTRDAAADPEDPLFRVGIAFERIPPAGRQRLIALVRESSALRIEPHA